MIWRDIICFALPLFVTLSGYFAANKTVNSYSSYFKYLSDQLPRVIIPYLIWSAVYGIIMLCNGTSVSKIIFKVLTFQASVPFYFIALIIQFYLLIPLTQRLANTKGLVATGFLAIFYCLALFYIKNILHYKLSVIMYAGNLFHSQYSMF